mmetsp:Transcript_1499/g.1983  ORF Transcript_1499/g.1983 Transcript_1499/m.1983 type:complete len:257 (+) Transcript_1499:37-807(+)
MPCSCETGCNTNRCSCYKEAKPCDSNSCHCKKCVNPLLVSCGCSTGCDNMRCSCQKANQSCHIDCKCASCKNGKPQRNLVVASPSTTAKTAITPTTPSHSLSSSNNNNNSNAPAPVVIIQQNNTYIQQNYEINIRIQIQNIVQGYLNVFQQNRASLVESFTENSTITFQDFVDPNRPVFTSNGKKQIDESLRGLGEVAFGQLAEPEQSGNTIIVRGQMKMRYQNQPRTVQFEKRMTLVDCPDGQRRIQTMTFSIAP